MVVPRAGVEPARPYGQRILSPAKSILPDLTKRDEPIFTGLAAVKVMLRPVTYRDIMSSSSRHQSVQILPASRDRVPRFEQLNRS